jgi:nascent polypeptide-associated complex subunit alpha
MLPGMNPKQMEAAMKAMGIKSRPVDAREVVIKLDGKEIVISNPQVTEIDMKGMKTFQVMGDVKERASRSYTDADVNMVMTQAGVSEKEARDALEKHGGDIAEAILELQG